MVRPLVTHNLSHWVCIIYLNSVIDRCKLFQRLQLVSYVCTKFQKIGSEPSWGCFVWLWLNQLLCCHTHLLHIVAALLYDIAIHSIPYTITVRFKRQYTILNGKHRKANRAISTSIEITIHCHDLGRVETFREVDEISY